MSAEPKTIAVYGATGTQGTAVSLSLLQSKQNFVVRAITRNPKAPKAQALARLGAQVVKADGFNDDEMLAALSGAWGFWLNTHHHDPALLTPEGPDDEAFGKRLVALAAKAGIKVFIYSTCESPAQFTYNKAPVPGMDGKNRVEMFARSFKEFDSVIGAFPGWYMENFLSEEYVTCFGGFPSVPDAEGYLTFHSPRWGGHEKVQFISIADDFGEMVHGMFLNPAKWKNKTIQCFSDAFTYDDMTKIFTEVTGKKARYVPMESYNDFPTHGSTVLEEIQDVFRLSTTGTSPPPLRAILSLLTQSVQGVVVLPTDVQGIARTVLYAKDHQLDLAVQGGGHSSSTASSTDGGILMNLGRMTRVSVDTSTQTVTVQGGATWADVARETAKYQLVVNGGTTSQVGVGGLTLRGGFGFLTPQHGVTLDTLLATKVVTGEGIELQVSTEEHSDLFWAIRGAGPNVAVVAEFKFRAYPQPNLVWSGLRIHASSEVLKVVEALNEALVHPQGRAAAQCILSLSPEDEKTPTVCTIIFFDGSEEEGRRHFARLLEVECIKDAIEMRPYSETITIWDPLAPPGGRKRELGLQMTLPPRLAFVAELMEKISDKLNKEPDLAKTDLEIDYLDPTQICRTPITETAFPARVNLLHATLMLQWTDAAKDEDFLAWGQSIQKLCENELTSQGHKLAHYVSNYNGYTQEMKVAAADMFGVNANRLLHIKAKYDPANLFNKLNPLDREL
ncbi:hypothetical protein CNMCM5623_003877 [Aspergillus felis]|uniref:FAD-binding PCMH-type domain-containing protein n=1 Tax=Aspergillus felis TaxID=1287682 RepID=A0A8H6UKZ7_9EURO|nr:hypothetical protein CNMCM5623_003877 [Aspergillus felis]